ncbi:MAG: F0F1 ATP synthase subunit A [Breznakibacter sp.]
MKCHINKLLLLTALTLFSFPKVLASSPEKGEKFNAVELIMHHISDAHSWTIFKSEHVDITLPLPIILWDEGNLSFFSSREFQRENKVVTKSGTHFVLHHEKIYKTDSQGTIFLDDHGHPTNSRPLDLSITKNVVGMWIAIAILLALFFSVARKYRNVMVKPRGTQSLMEPLILFVRDDIAGEMIGKEKSAKYVPYLLTLFFFIWINNLLGLVPFFPGGANVTGNIAITALLSVITLLITNISGSKSYWKHIVAPPGVPYWITPLLVPVEIIGIFTKPFSLMMRLFANITAGHIIILSLLSIIFAVQSLAFAPVSIILVVFMMVLELLVGFLQAFIFTMLTALFIGLAVHEDSH